MTLANYSDLTGYARGMLSVARLGATRRYRLWWAIRGGLAAIE